MPRPNNTEANPQHEDQRRELVARIARLRVEACSDGDREVREALEAAALAKLRMLDNRRTER